MQRAVHLQKRSIAAIDGALLVQALSLFLLRLCTCNLDLTLSHVLIQFLHMRDTQAHYGFDVNAKSICSSHFVQIYPEMVLHACLYHAFKRGRSWLVGLSKMRDTDG